MTLGIGMLVDLGCGHRIPPAGQKTVILLDLAIIISSFVIGALFFNEMIQLPPTGSYAFSGLGEGLLALGGGFLAFDLAAFIGILCKSVCEKC